jgi:hypothetical protein
MVDVLTGSVARAGVRETVDRGACNSDSSTSETRRCPGFRLSDAGQVDSYHDDLDMILR